MATAKAAKTAAAEVKKKAPSAASKAAKAKPVDKAPAKAAPRKRAAKPALAMTQAREESFSEQVSRLAYQYWEERGCPLGSSHEDWFRAEQALMQG
jgi:hypothetical protein